MATTAVVPAAVNCEINSDTTSGDYAGYYWQGGKGGNGIAGALSGSSTGINCFNVAAASATNVSSTATVSFAGYSGTTFYKPFLTQSWFPQDSTFGDVSTVFFSGSWKSTSAITSIVLTDATGGHFIAGTTFTLYGLL